METAIRIVDATASGKILRETRLELVRERLTARELIERRVRQEVAAFNARAEAQVFEGLVQPSDTEAELNGFRLRHRHPLDPDAQCAAALVAFEGNGFLLLVGERQVTSLDEEIVLSPELRVDFVKLVPLVGG